MRTLHYSSATEFLARTRALFETDEVRYSVILGVASACAGGHTYGPEAPWFGVVEDAGRLRAVAMHTPPYPLNLALSDIEASEQLARELSSTGRVLPSVIGPIEWVEDFARLWCQARGCTSRIGMHQRQYRLDTVIAPPDPAPGCMRLARSDDLERLQPWILRFAIDCGLDAALARGGLRAFEEQRLFVWEANGELRSMAALVRPSSKAVSIGLVYTPDAERGRGYASALVAALSQQALDGGKSFCLLFTDLANPTSNKIYAQIGYAPVTDFMKIDFS